MSTFATQGVAEGLVTSTSAGAGSTSWSHGRRAVTADTDLRLCRCFGLSEGLFLRLQVEFDLEEARRRLGDRLEKEVAPRAV